MSKSPNKSGADFAPRSFADSKEIEAYKKIALLLRESPIPQNEILANIAMFNVRASFVRMQFMYMLYKKALSTHGVVMEFGTRWGKNLSLFTTFRNVHEPYNRSRKIIGFDTFEGFPGVNSEDGAAAEVRKGAYGIGLDYVETLCQLLEAQEALAPRGHIKKHEVVVGDVMETLPAYLEAHPETIIALAYLDLDLYEPTKKVLETIRPYLVKNSVIGFDELVYEEFPGETKALRDAWGHSQFELIRKEWAPQQSYLVL